MAIGGKKSVFTITPKISQFAFPKAGFGRSYYRCRPISPITLLNRAKISIELYGDLNLV